LLPSNLLRMKVKKGEVKPVFLEPSLHIGMAEELIKVYSSSIQKKKREIIERLSTLEGLYDYRVVRGLSTLLERRCIFEVKSALDPMKARMTLFELASKERAITKEERERVVLLASEKLGIKPQDLEDALLADLDSEQVLVAFNDLPPDSLLKVYNLSVLQTLLFKALRMEFTASGNWKRIFREIKRQGLMYTVESVDGQEEGYKVTVEGPLSLFRMTERYGTSLAKLIPHIISAPSWGLKADILARSKGRVYTFQLTSREAARLMENQYEEPRQKDEYDSSLEERFARNFEAMNTGWSLRREPEPLLAGTHVLIPDFCFEKEGRREKVYLEIVGYWTEEYLKRKVSKLNQLSTRHDIIIAADESLACSKLSRVKGNLIYFKKSVPLAPIIQHLKKYDQMFIQEQAKSFNPQIKLDAPLIKLKDIASKQCVDLETVLNSMTSISYPGYLLLHDILISKEFLIHLESSLAGCKNLEEAIRTLEQYGIEDPYPIFEALGYRVTWVGLDAQKAKIEKVDPTLKANPR